MAGIVLRSMTKAMMGKYKNLKEYRAGQFTYGSAFICKNG
jgi:hypothetical protein